MASPAGAHVALALRRHSSLRLARMVTTMLRSSGWSGLVVLSTLASPSWWSADCAASMVAATSFMAAGEPMAISDGCMPICLNWAVGGAMPLATGITVGTSVRTDMSRKKESVFGVTCVSPSVYGTRSVLNIWYRRVWLSRSHSHIVDQRGGNFDKQYMPAIPMNERVRPQRVARARTHTHDAPQPRR